MRNVFTMVLFILCGFCSAQAKVVDRIYAQINDDIITMSDINRRMDTIRRELSKRYSGDQLEQAVMKQQEGVLDSLIEEKLLIQKAVEVGIDAEVEPKVSSTIQKVMKDNGIEEMDQLEEILENQGDSLNSFRDSIRDEIMQQEVISIFVHSRISLLTQEVDQYYKDHARDFATPEEVSLSEIIITDENEGSEEGAQSRVRDLYNRLKKGESFKSLANQYSKGSTANKGGSIGNNLLEKWHPDIVKAIEGLESGESSEPQKTPEGYVIYHVDDRKHSTIPPMEEVETEIKNLIWSNKVRPELRRFINRLKEDAYIQIYPDPE